MEECTITLIYPVITDGRWVKLATHLSQIIRPYNARLPNRDIQLVASIHQDIGFETRDCDPRKIGAWQTLRGFCGFCGLLAFGVPKTFSRNEERLGLGSFGHKWDIKHSLQSAWTLTHDHIWAILGDQERGAVQGSTEHRVEYMTTASLGVKKHLARHDPRRLINCV